MRAVFYDAWRHFKEQAPLTGVEALIVEALIAHPEYQPLFDDGRPSDIVDPTAGPGANPFLHLGLHIAIAEQITTDRPPGVAHEWQRLQDLWQDAHRARHAMMECLEETLWEAQSRGAAPDDSTYIERLRALGRGGRKK